MNTPSPIGISTYKRISHLKQTVEALKRNTIAKQSSVYFFSDAPRKGDESEVESLRNYLRRVDGFGTINIVERKKNNRVQNNRGGMRYLLQKYGKMIWLEEDIVTAPGFLQFLNDALSYYEDNNKIISISGYVPPIGIPYDYGRDVLILQRFNAWGFATWLDRFDPFGFDLKTNDFEKFLNDKYMIRKFVRNGEDMYRGLLKVYDKSIDALDYKVMYYQFKNDLYTIYPSKSLVQNIGNDGTGIHCGTTQKFWHEYLWSKTDRFCFVDAIHIDKDIAERNRRFRRLPFKARLNNRINKLPWLHKALKMIRIPMDRLIIVLKRAS